MPTSLLPDVDDERAAFLSTPWCASLLADPSYQIITTTSRQRKPDREDALLAEALNTPDTITAWTTLLRKPPPGKTLVSEVRILVALGHGTNGYPGTAHGGFLGVIVDEAMGLLLLRNRGARADEVGGDGYTGYAVTASLKVDYLKAVVTPGIVMVTAEFGRAEGRKRWITATVEDGRGTVLARAEGLWITVGSPKL
ncbi:hypothetical protein MMC21_006338 [Puttea exsequens]|nr:hypothetical protein [Puttea exsequens]